LPFTSLTILKLKIRILLYLARSYLIIFITLFCIKDSISVLLLSLKGFLGVLILPSALNLAIKARSDSFFIVRKVSKLRLHS